MEQSGEKITKENSREHTRHRVAEAFLDAPERTMRKAPSLSHRPLYPAKRYRAYRGYNIHRPARTGAALNGSVWGKNIPLTP